AGTTASQQQMGRLAVDQRSTSLLFERQFAVEQMWARTFSNHCQPVPAVVHNVQPAAWGTEQPRGAVDRSRVQLLSIGDGSYGQARLPHVFQLPGVELRILEQLRFLEYARRLGGKP